MTSPTFGPENLQWVGLAPEVTYGTPIAVPTYFVPAETPQQTFQQATMVDGALRGNMGTEFQQLRGLRADQLTFKTYFYLDSVYYFFRAALGLPDVLTGSADPYTHKTSLQSGGTGGQPKSTTLFWNDGQGKTFQTAGAQVTDVKVTFTSDGLASLEVTWLGLPSVQITPPTNTPTTSVPMPSWNTTITLAGASQQKYSEIALEVKRDTKMIPAITGTQAPFAIFCGGCSVSGSFTGVYQGTTDNDLLNDLGNLQPALTISIAPVGDATHSITLQLSKVAYDDAQISGNTWMEIKSTIKGLTNPVDVAGTGGMSPMLVTLTSPISTAI